MQQRLLQHWTELSLGIKQKRTLACKRLLVFVTTYWKSLLNDAITKSRVKSCFNVHFKCFELLYHFNLGFGFRCWPKTMCNLAYICFYSHFSWTIMRWVSFSDLRCLKLEQPSFRVLFHHDATAGDSIAPRRAVWLQLPISWQSCSFIDVTSTIRTCIKYAALWHPLKRKKAATQPLSARTVRIATSLAPTSNQPMGQFWTRKSNSDVRLMQPGLRFFTRKLST